MGYSLTQQEQLIVNSIKSELPHTCYYCGKNIEDNKVTVDHKHPVSRGGLTTKENLVIACENCNRDKSNMTEEEYFTYKKQQKEFHNGYEVNKSISQLIEIQNNIISRIEQVKNDYSKIEKQIETVQEDILYSNFNASEGYMYSKQLQELLNQKNELFVIKKGYFDLHMILNSQKKQLNDFSVKITQEVEKDNNLILRKRILGKPKLNNVIKLKSVI